MAYYKTPDYCFIVPFALVKVLLLELQSLFKDHPHESKNGSVYFDLFTKQKKVGHQFKGTDKVFIVLFFDERIIEKYAEEIRIET